MKEFKAKVQVNREHYAFGHEVSFLNAYNQTKDVLYLVQKHRISDPKILVVGVGDDLLGIILKNKFNFQVKTIDIDSQLRPDFVGSIDEIDSIINEKFDIIVCAHVLEHLPDEYFEKSLKKIQRAARYSIIYLPIAQFGFRINFELFPIFSKQINFLSTWFFKKHRFDGQHYWEIGTKGHPLSLVKRKIERCFVIEREYNALNWLYSYNFILKSKKISHDE